MTSPILARCSRRSALKRGMAAAATAVFPAAASAQDSWPAKPLRWIVPFPAGGPSDLYSRQVAAELANIVGQTVLVDNVAGAGGNIGCDRIAKAAPDGYTIGMATTGTHTISPHLYATMPYDTLKDFTALSLVARYANQLLVSTATPFQTVGELVAYAKANPGKVSFSSAGNGSSNHLSGEILKLVTGASMIHIPYRGSAAALAGVMSGDVTCMFEIPIGAMQAVRAGKARILAVTTTQRWPFSPSVPTMAEAGVDGFAQAGTDLWFGAIGPAGIPPAVMQRLHPALIKALQSPRVREFANAQQFEVWTSTPEEFAREIAMGRERWGRIVKASGAKAD